jgi:hypothetical protein
MPLQVYSNISMLNIIQLQKELWWDKFMIGVIETYIAIQVRCPIRRAKMKYNTYKSSSLFIQKENICQNTISYCVFQIK